MASSKEIVEQEQQRMSNDIRYELHLFKEGTFLRAYEWSAWLACHLNALSCQKRSFQGIEQPVVFIGFPVSSLQKWIPEDAEETAYDDKHLMIRLPERLIAEPAAEQPAAFASWKESLPLSESKASGKKRGDGHNDSDSMLPAMPSATITQVMQRILAYPLESKSPIDCMLFVAELKRQLAAMI